MTPKHALVVGATGVSGSAVTRRLLKDGGWRVTTLSRGPLRGVSGARHIAVDALDGAAVSAALNGLHPTHVFFCAWTLGANEDENGAKNGALLTNVLDAAGSRLRHVGLVTGMKHYLGPFEDFARNRPVTPFREDAPRLPGRNFYYVLEDILTERGAAQGFGWSVHRSQSIIGLAPGNRMNMAATLAVYATLARETGLPFVFPGHPNAYHGLNDVTDARVLADQMVWAATEPAARNEAFNVANGDVIRWRDLWADMARYFGVAAAPFPERQVWLEPILRGQDAAWDAVVARHGLQPLPLSALNSAWFTDLDLGRPMECVNDLNKSRRLGFTGFIDTTRSFTDAFDQLRRARIIP